MDAQTIYIDFIMPKGWHELTDTQLRYIYRLISLDFSANDIAIFSLLKWNQTKVIGRQPNGEYLLKKGKTCFEVSALSIAELLPLFDWIANLPLLPVRLSSIHEKTALPADFQGVPFQSFIICDNLFQGYLHTQQDSLLDELAPILYPNLTKIDDVARINIFYWFASLKEYLSNRFSDFFQPIAGAVEGNMLGSPNIGIQLQEAMDAQIRALTKGDITKESEILALDTWRALTELNLQVREY